MSPEREREFRELNEVVTFYSTTVRGIDPASPIHPQRVLLEIVERVGRSKGLEGLKQATNDILEEVSGWPVAAVELLDEALRNSQLVTVSELRRRYAASFKRIVKRGAIRTETEYHIVNGIVVDQGTNATETERAQLQVLLDAYEMSSNPTFQRTASPPLN